MWERLMRSNPTWGVFSSWWLLGDSKSFSLGLWLLIGISCSIRWGYSLHMWSVLTWHVGLNLKGGCKVQRGICWEPGGSGERDWKVVMTKIYCIHIWEFFSSIKIIYFSNCILGWYILKNLKLNFKIYMFASERETKQCIYTVMILRKSYILWL